MNYRIVSYDYKSIPEEVFEPVANIRHDAFEERRQQNINFKCGTHTASDVKKDLQGNNYLFLVYNEENELVGSATLKIRQKAGYSYGACEHLSVASSCKRQGIGSMLVQERKKKGAELGLDFLASSTACNAISSVKYHKKSGFIIYMKTFSKGYNSYSFIYPMKKMKFLRFEPIRLVVFAFMTMGGRYKKMITALKKRR